MTCYRIIYSKDAEKFMKANKQIGIRFMKAFYDLAENPSFNSTFFDIKKIRGVESDNVYRLRISKYRAIFEVNNNKITICVINIDSRGDIYKSI